MRIKRSKDVVVLRAFCYIVLTVVALISLLPFVLIISASFSSELSILQHGYSLVPHEFSTSAYRMIFEVPGRVFQAYRVTFIITIAGTVMGLLIMSMAAYVLNRKDFKYRNFFSFMLYFTTLFSGGLVPYYIMMVRFLHVRDTLWAMMLPGLASVWSILLMRNFMKSIPDSLVESGKIDGAGDFYIYLRIILPLAGPALATIGLFTALSYWNEWYNAMLFVQDRSLHPLQLFLKNMLSSKNIIELVKSGINVSKDMIPTESMKMAMAVIATGPVLLFYPFAQKYFVSGLTVGAVKA